MVDLGKPGASLRKPAESGGKTSIMVAITDKETGVTVEAADIGKARRALVKAQKAVMAKRAVVEASRERAYTMALASIGEIASQAQACRRTTGDNWQHYATLVDVYDEADKRKAYRVDTRHGTSLLRLGSDIEITCAITSGGGHTLAVCTYNRKLDALCWSGVGLVEDDGYVSLAPMPDNLAIAVPDMA